MLGLTTIPVGLAGGGWWWLALAIAPAGVLCAPSLTAAADSVSRLTPVAVRGEAMGWHNSANTVGLAIGGPLSGAVIDATAPGWGFAVVGALGVLVGIGGFMLYRGRGRQPATEPELVAAG